MSRASVEVTRVGPVWMDSASDGMTVVYYIPAGCVLTRDGATVNDASGFVHVGPLASYRIDCVSYSGTPIAAVLDIS